MGLSAPSTKASGRGSRGPRLCVLRSPLTERPGGRPGEPCNPAGAGAAHFTDLHHHDIFLSIRDKVKSERAFSDPLRRGPGAPSRWLPPGLPGLQGQFAKGSSSKAVLLSFLFSCFTVWPEGRIAPSTNVCVFSSTCRGEAVRGRRLPFSTLPGTPRGLRKLASPPRHLHNREQAGWAAQVWGARGDF